MKKELRIFFKYLSQWEIEAKKKNSIYSTEEIKRNISLTKKHIAEIRKEIALNSKGVKID